ncbi:MAG: MBL fold metallo-hydrolase [Actinomycetota bacterium]
MSASLPGIIPVDTLMTGREHVTCAYLVDGPEPLLVEAGPASSSPAVTRSLTEAGIAPDDLAHLVLTHIHLDHAGGAGALAQAFPNATIWIHVRAARHLADPARLVASASRIYGDEGVRTLFGLPAPVETARIRSLEGGDTITFAGRSLEALATPGHASSHLAFQDSDSGIVFTGDAVGVHLPGVDVIRPAAPPPEFDIDQAIASIGVIADRARGTLLFAHFGPVSDVEGTCAQAVETLRRWSDAARDGIRSGLGEEDIEAALTAIAREQEEALAEGDRERFEIIGSVRMNTLGLSRYWRERTGTERKDTHGGGEAAASGQDS